MNWNEYQEAVAAFFRSIGAKAQTDAVGKGVRGSHKVDVLVKLKHFGVEVVWIIECKLWKTSVPKEKILTLQQIVQDVGADRGFLMSESGFQAGAIKSARSSNITLSSLTELQEIANDELLKVRVKKISIKLEELIDRYHTFVPWAKFNNVKPLHLVDDQLPNLFMIRLEIFKIYNGNFPVRFMSRTISNMTDFIAECNRIFEDCEAQITKVENHYNQEYKTGQVLHKRLKKLISKLVESAFEITRQIGNSEIQDQLRIKAVEVMKKIGDSSLKLRAYTTNTSFPYLAEIQKLLIDGLYLDLMNENLQVQDVQQTSDKLNKAVAAFEAIFQPISNPPAPKTPS